MLLQETEYLSPARPIPNHPRVTRIACQVLAAVGKALRSQAPHHLLTDVGCRPETMAFRNWPDPSSKKSPTNPFWVTVLLIIAPPGQLALRASPSINDNMESPAR